jgi:23S rRNA (uracil1939-C5)-methyltransferase
MQLKIEKLIYGGDGLAHLPADDRGPGKTVFVPFVLEGEQVEAELTEQKPGFARARLERVRESSQHRVEARCPYFQRCGGCQYQHIDYQHQLEIKASILRETLKRTAKIDLPCELQVHPSPEWNYRNRTRLKIQTEPEFALGYYKFRSHELLRVEECPISSLLINRAIAGVWELGRSSQTFSALSEIEFFVDHADAALLIEAYCRPGTSKADAQQIADTLANTLPEVKGVVAFEQLLKQTPDPKRLALRGEPAILYQTKLCPYYVSAGSFFQVNRFLVDELVRIVTSDAAGQLALDLYAGVGLFSTVLARSFAQVIAVEASQTSYSDLRQNVPQEVKAVRATTEQYLAQVSGIKPDLVVVDPPRSGVGEGAVRNLAKLGAPRITYVSCDPSTLARDLRTLLTSGYQIAGVHMIDLFPQTYHLESVFHLAK